METTTKKDMIRMIANKTGIAHKEIETVLECEHTLIIKEVTQGRKVCYRGFGDYKPKEYKAKAVRNIKQGTTFIMPAKTKPVFKASPYFCKEVAGE